MKRKNKMDRKQVQYKYDLHGHYYELTNFDKFKEITENEYLEKTGDKLKNIDELRKSRYPEQINDYVMLKAPKSYVARGNNLIPIDYEIANIIKLFWKMGINTKGIDKSGHIDTEHVTFSGKDVVPLFVKLFGEKNIKIFDLRNIEPIDKPGVPNEWRISKEHDDIVDKITNFRKRIKIIVYIDFVRIIFKPSSLPWVYYKLNIKSVKYKKALKGDRVVMDRDITIYKIKKL